MIEVPIAELMDDSICLIWLERHRHPEGFSCPHCDSTDRRLFRQPRHVPAYRCRPCDGSYTLLTGTVFEKTRQRPAMLVLLLRSIAPGEPTARMARELGLSRKQWPTLRRRVQANLNETAPTALMAGTPCEADELSQNAGEKKHPASRPSRFATAARS